MLAGGLRESVHFQAWQDPATRTSSAGPVFSLPLGPNLLQAAAFLHRMAQAASGAHPNGLSCLNSLNKSPFPDS